MYPSTRLSRIGSPRATLWSIVLLVAVLGLFGAWANSSHTPPSETKLEYAGDHRSLTFDEAIAPVAIR